MYMKRMRPRMRTLEGASGQVQIPVERRVKILPIVESVAVFGRAALATDGIALNLQRLALVARVEIALVLRARRLLVVVLRFVDQTRVALLATHLHILQQTST